MLGYGTNNKNPAIIDLSVQFLILAMKKLQKKDLEKKLKPIPGHYFSDIPIFTHSTFF